jgi:hypothetical protein
VEFKLQAHLIEYQTASFADSYQNAHLTEGANPTQKTFNPTLSITGEDIPKVHKLQFSLGAHYARPFNSNWDRLAADVYYRGPVDSYFASNPFIRATRYCEPPAGSAAPSISVAQGGPETA